MYLLHLYLIVDSTGLTEIALHILMINPFFFNVVRDIVSLELEKPHVNKTGLFENV